MGRSVREIRRKEAYMHFMHKNAQEWDIGT